MQEKLENILIEVFIFYEIYFWYFYVVTSFLGQHWDEIYIIVKLYVQIRHHKEIDPTVTATTEAKPCCSRLENQVIFLARDPSLRWLFHPQVWPLLTIRFIRQPLGCHTTEVRRHYTIWFCWMVGTLMFNTYPFNLNFWIMFT